MARQFTGTQYGTLVADVINADQVFTLLAWVKKSSLDSLDQFVFGACRSTSFERTHGIIYRGTQTGQRMGAYHYGGSATYAAGGVDSVIDTWIPVVYTRKFIGTGTQDVDVDIYLSSTRYTAAGSLLALPSGTPDRLIVGGTLASGALSKPFIGLIGAVAKWNVVLSSGNIDSLLAGADPSTIDSGNLYDSWTFDSDTGSTSTGINANVITWTGSPTYVSDSPFTSGQTLTAPFLSSSTTLSSPDLVQKVSVTTPSYDPSSIFYAYTGDTPTSPDFFYIRESTFYNTDVDGTGLLNQTTSAPVDFNYFDDSDGTWSGWVTFDVADLSVPTLSSGTVLYEMTVQGDEITLSPPLLDSSASLYASTVSATYGLEVPLLDSSASLYAPEVDNGYSISVPLLSATTALFVPEISTTVELAAPLLASELVLYEPTLTSVVRLEVPLLEEETELLAPGVGMFIGISGPLVRVVSGRNYTYKVK